MPVSPVAANSTATSGWANSVSTSVNDIEGDIYAAGQLAIPWASVTAKPTTFTPAAHKASHAAGGADVLAYADISGKPSTFTPAAHKASHATGASDAIAPADINAPAARVTPNTPASFRIYVGTATPTGMAEGDIWIKG